MVINNPFPSHPAFCPDLDAKDQWFTAPGDCEGPLDAPNYMPAGSMMGVGLEPWRRSIYSTATR